MTVRPHHRQALVIAAIYAIFGALWIFLSDGLVAAIAEDAAALSHLQTWKGWFFIGVTALLVYFLARRALGVQAGLLERAQRREAEIQALNAELEQRVAERTARVEAVNRELETFAYTVSHDLKAPLRAIDGYSQLLLHDHAQQVDEDGRTLIGNLRQAGRLMNRLIDDLLAYSHMERRALHPTRVALKDVIDGVVAGFGESVLAEGPKLEIEIDCESASADPEALAMVLRNLLDNALKFSRETPEPLIEIGSRVRDGRCLLWVRDNGIGFDMKYRDRIFEIFHRLPQAEAYPGTGIGLVIVRKAVERMDGRVWAESAPGAGATFFVELPA